MKIIKRTEQIKASLAVLTWKSPKTLAACLASIEPLFEFFDERLIVCQEGDPQEIKIAESFGMRVIAPEENLGIQGGIKKCFETACNELVLFCENDLQLRIPKEEALKIMQFSAEYMNSGEAQCTFLRYRPESADRRGRDFNKYWRIKGGRVTKKLRAYLRPSVASFSLGKGVYLIHKDALDCANFHSIKTGFLLTDSSCIPHENLALFAKKSYINDLIEFAEANPTSRTVNGSPDLEHPINSAKNRHWFIDKKFKILISCPGVFGHRRYDRHADDEKWNMVDPLDEGGEVVISQVGGKMNHNGQTTDDSSPYGTYRPGIFARGLINVTRKLPTNWLGHRLMFILRRIAALGVGEKVDVELFGSPMRLHSEANVSEKRALYASQFFDLEERRALMALAEDNAVFIDIGANIGLYSFSTASAFKNFRNTRILAVEPHPIISRRLAYNLSLNSCLPIEPIVAGLSDREGVMTMVTPEHNLGESRLLKDGETAPGKTTDIPVKTLLNLLAEQSVSRLDGMKIDIEGYEEAVLVPFFDQAPDGLLPRLIIIENNHKKWKKDLVGLAKSRGYFVRSTTRMNVMLEKIS